MLGPSAERSLASKGQLVETCGWPPVLHCGDPAAWQGMSELVPALDLCFNRTCEELCFDVTSLPKIMLEECLTSFQDLVKDCALTADQHQAYVNRIKK
mmetsp:Transcript_134190/g.428786  ORF Transcript_134190/g.428786 Transcript_134190/m.428786 type:complete len:98 (+) Transcript_134190:48-341(+)